MELEREISRFLKPHPIFVEEEEKRDEQQEKIWTQVNDSSSELLIDDL